MAHIDWSALYLGTIADIDTDETNPQAEDPNALIGTYGSAGSPLNGTRTVITTTSDEDDAVELDHGVANTPDTVEYDLGAGPVTTQLDTVALVDGMVTFDDGTTMTGTFGVVQDATGALFLTISDSQTTLASKPVESLEITSVLTTSFAGASQTTRDDLQFVCFAEGTLIATPNGPVAVDALRPDDLVDTLDHGAQEVRWIGIKRFPPDKLKRNPRLLPVTFEAGALGQGLPRRPLQLSANHRVLASGPVAERKFGPREVLRPARHLVGLPGVRRAAVGAGVAYYHV